MKCTGRSGDVLTVTRGQDGTSAADHTAGAIIEQRNNAAMWNDIATAVNLIENGTTPVPLNPPDSSITDDKLAPNVARPNLIQNGGFEVWTRGQSFTITSGSLAAFPFTANNWRPYLAGGPASFAVNREAAIVAPGSRYSCAVTIVNYDAVNQPSLFQDLYLDGTGGSNNGLTYILRGKTVTVSAWVRSATANAVRLMLSDGVTSLNGSFHPGDNTWRQVTVGPFVWANNSANGNITISFSANGTFYVDNLVLAISEVAVDYTPLVEYPDALPNERLASDTARANLLTNGGFEIWQRGSGPFAANTSYSVDRWALSIGAASALSISRQAGNNSPYAASFSYSHSAASQLIQRVEGGSLAGRTVTFSIDVFTASANAVRVLVWDQLGALSYSAFHTGNSTWQRLTSSMLVSTSATTLQVYVEFDASAGGAIDNAMLVVGSIPADYAPLHPADDLARCQRYYEVIGESIYSLIVGGYMTAGGSLYQTIPYKVRKAVVPTCTKVGTWATTNMTGQPVIDISGLDCCRVSFVITATGYSNANNTATGNCITVEANP